MRWTGRAPKASYGGFDNLPSDMVITGDAVLIDSFKNGRINEQYYVWDMFGFMMDLAQGDMKKMAAAMLKMDAVMQAARKAAAEGTPLPMQPPHD
jgi:hypothetical protein